MYGLGERVVLFLIEEELHKNIIIYFDNFFTSVVLLEKLKAEKFMTCGTIKNNSAEIPENIETDKLLNKQFSKDEFYWRVSNTGIIHYKWKDNIAPNFHGTEESIVTRKGKERAKRNDNAPEAIKDYINCISGVDNHDQLRYTYTVDRRYKKRLHRLFFGLKEITFFNAYVLAKQY